MPKRPDSKRTAQAKARDLLRKEQRSVKLSLVTQAKLSLIK